MHGHPGAIIWALLYLLVVGVLAIYGVHRYCIVFLYFKNRNKEPKPLREFETLPRITVQLPIFNELYVVERLLKSVAELDYPRHLLQIQVLDDSTDETTSLAEAGVQELDEDEEEEEDEEEVDVPDEGTENGPDGEPRDRDGEKGRGP